MHDLPSMRQRRTFLAAGAACLLAPVVRAQAAQQAFPVQPVRIVVPFTPGGGTDLVARTISHHLTERWKESIVIENKGGAGGSIGTEVVVRTKPDGYTWAVGSVATIAINSHVYSNLGYDPLTDLVPVVHLCDAPNVLVVHPSVPARTLAEFIAYAKTRNGQLSYGSTGVGTSPHLSGYILAKQTGFEAVHVPYKGMNALNDLLGNRVQFMFATIPSVISHIKAGKLRPVAMSSADRARSLPDIPTIAELGFPDFDTASWNGFFMPKGTPGDLVTKVNQDVNEILLLPSVQETFVREGMNPKGNSSPADFARFVKREYDRWGEIVRDSGVTVES